MFEVLVPGNFQETLYSLQQSLTLESQDPPGVYIDVVKHPEEMRALPWLRTTEPSPPKATLPQTLLSRGSLLSSGPSPKSILASFKLFLIPLVSTWQRTFHPSIAPSPSDICTSTLAAVGKEPQPQETGPLHSADQDSDWS